MGLSSLRETNKIDLNSGRRFSSLIYGHCSAAWPDFHKHLHGWHYSFTFSMRKRYNNLIGNVAAGLTFVEYKMPNIAAEFLKISDSRGTFHSQGKVTHECFFHRAIKNYKTCLMEI